MRHDAAHTIARAGCGAGLVSRSFSRPLRWPLLGVYVVESPISSIGAVRAPIDIRRQRDGAPTTPQCAVQCTARRRCVYSRSSESNPTVRAAHLLRIFTHADADFRSFLMAD